MVAIRAARPNEWRQARRLRLESLAESPHAFDDPLHVATQWPDQRWQDRLISQLMPDSCLWVALEGENWVGRMGAREYPAGVWLLEVYLSPALRGQGVAQELLGRVEVWTRERGHKRLLLDVHQDAAAAISFYLRMGFERTGNTQPYVLDPAQVELEFSKRLDS